MIRVSNSLDPDQGLNSVGPDLGPNCLQSHQQTTNVPTSKERVNILRGLQETGRD